MEYIEPPKTRRETKKKPSEKRALGYNIKYVRLTEKILDRKIKKVSES